MTKFIVDSPLLVFFKFWYALTIIDEDEKCVTASLFQDHYPVLIQKDYISPMLPDEILYYRPSSKKFGIEEWSPERQKYWKSVFKSDVVYYLATSELDKIIFPTKETKDFYRKLYYDTMHPFRGYNYFAAKDFPI